MNTFTAATPVTSQQIADQVITAIEGGIGYWCEGVDLLRPGRETLAEKPWYADPALYDVDFAIEVREQESHKVGQDTKWLLTPASIQSGLNVMAAKYANHLGDMLTENGDADTADVFIQCCLFGDLIYG